MLGCFMAPIALAFGSWSAGWLCVAALISMVATTLLGGNGRPPLPRRRCYEPRGLGTGLRPDTDSADRCLLTQTWWNYLIVIIGNSVIRNPIPRRDTIMTVML